jgi:hypothetical protein
MDQNATTRFGNLLQLHVNPADKAPPLDIDNATRLLARTANVPFFTHSYSFYHGMNNGFTPADLVRFAYENDLHGICLHISDGGSSCVRTMTPSEQDVLRKLAEDLRISIHLEISSTDRREIDTVIECARVLGVCNLRFYARHEGPLSSVIEKAYADLAYACDLAHRHDLYFDYEQHEDLRADEIAALLARINDRRMNALFDYSNSLNAYEEPLAALRVLAPYIRQVHIKGARKLIEGDGWGQLGVVQGSSEDQLPNARMLYELLMLGEDSPQVICFALEQEVDYYAPAFRRRDEPADPIIQYREPSETPVDYNKSTERLLSDERRWANQQIAWNRGLVGTFRELAYQVVPEQRRSDLPTVAYLPECARGNMKEGDGFGSGI